MIQTTDPCTHQFTDPDPVTIPGTVQITDQFADQDFAFQIGKKKSESLREGSVSGPKYEINAHQNKE